MAPEICAESQPAASLPKERFGDQNRANMIKSKHIKHDWWVTRVNLSHFRCNFRAFLMPSHGTDHSGALGGVDFAGRFGVPKGDLR